MSGDSSDEEEHSTDADLTEALYGPTVAAAMAGSESLTAHLYGPTLTAAMAGSESLTEHLYGPTLTAALAGTESLTEHLYGPTVTAAMTGSEDLTEYLYGPTLTAALAGTESLHEHLYGSILTTSLADTIIGSEWVSAFAQSRSSAIKPDAVIPVDSDLETDSLDAYGYYKSPEWLSAKVVAIAVLLTEYILRSIEAYQQEERVRRDTNIVAAIVIVILLPRPVWTKIAAIIGIASGIKSYYTPELDE